MRTINTNTINNYEYYVRGAAGQIMATYTQNTTPAGTTFVPEHVLYGAARLGTATPGTAGQHRTGLRTYELTDHLASVRATVSDRRTAKGSLPTILSATDYYPFGMAISSRSKPLDASKLYTYGFGGQQISDEINANSYTAQFWQYDARIGRRLNLDPIDQFSISNYAAFANNPIRNVDVNGDDWYQVNSTGQLHFYPEGKYDKGSVPKGMTYVGDPLYFGGDSFDAALDAVASSKNPNKGITFNLENSQNIADMGGKKIAVETAIVSTKTVNFQVPTSGGAQSVTINDQVIVPLSFTITDKYKMGSESSSKRLNFSGNPATVSTDVSRVNYKYSYTNTCISVFNALSLSSADPDALVDRKVKTSGVGNVSINISKQYNSLSDFIKIEGSLDKLNR